MMIVPAHSLPVSCFLLHVSLLSLSLSVSVSEDRICCCVREDGRGELGRRRRWRSCCSCPSSCPPPLRLHRCSSLVQTSGLQNLQVPSTFSCGTCFWGGFYSLGTCFLEIFRRPFPGVQVPIIGFSVPDLQNEVPCVCRSLALCLCLSSLLCLSLSSSLSRALSRSPSPLLRPDFLPLLSEQCK